MLRKRAKVDKTMEDHRGQRIHGPNGLAQHEYLYENVRFCESSVLI